MKDYFDSKDFMFSSSNISDSTIVEEGAMIHRSVKIGANTIIKAYAIIEEGCVIGDNCFVGYHAVLFKNTIMGDRSKICHNVVCEGDAIIGNDCLIHDLTHLTNGPIIEDRVFIGPSVTMGNDLKMVHMRRERNPFVRKPPIFKKGCRVGAGSIILPGVIVGQECFIGAGSLVIKNTKSFGVYVGQPAKIIGAIPPEELLSW